jgi:hypothetical protein
MGETLCSTPDGITGWVTIRSKTRRFNTNSAQRLTASQVRSQGYQFSTYATPLCLTPYGIGGWVSSRKLRENGKTKVVLNAL